MPVQSPPEKTTTTISYKVIDQPWSPDDPSLAEAMLTGLGQDGWNLVTAYPDPTRERTRWIFAK